MSFPTSTPSYAGFTSSHTLSQDNHASQHNAEQADITALGAKVGTGASTPSNGTFLRGNGAGTSAWAGVGLGTSDVSGILPVSNGGTGQTSSTGSGAVVLQNAPNLVNATGSFNQPTISDFTNANHNHQNAVGGGQLAGSALQNNAVGYQQLSLGAVVQVQGSLYSAVATGTTQIPNDDTMPQNTEGDQYMTQAITPKSATNTLVIQINAFVSDGTATQIITGALFQDSNVNALAATASFTDASTIIPRPLTLFYFMTAGSTSSTTFKFRAGPHQATTVTFNGVNGGRLYGAIPKSSMIIWEYNS